MTKYNYNYTSQLKNTQGQDLGADAMLMAEFIEEMEALKPSYNKNDFGNAQIANSESISTLKENNNIHYYDDIPQSEYEKQNVEIGDFSQSTDNTKTNSGFLTIFPSSTIHSAFLGEVTQQAEKQLIEKVIDWGKANPGKTLLLAGLAATGGYFLYNNLINQEKQESRFSLQSKGKARLKRKQRTQSGKYRNINSGLGKTPETEEYSQSDSIKEAALNLLAFFGGGVAGSPIGKQSVFIGIPLTLYGLYRKNNYATCAGIGMAINSYVIDIFKKKEINNSNAQVNNSLTTGSSNEIKADNQSEVSKATFPASEAETLPTTFKQPAQTLAGNKLDGNNMNSPNLQGEPDNMKVLFEDDFLDKEF